MSLEYKSTGAIIDEWITATMKAKANPSEENTSRSLALFNLVDDRVSTDQWDSIENLVLELKYWLKQCWDAQENFRDYKDLTEEQINSGDYDVYKLAWAGITAQRTNAARCALVRKIDTVLGEQDRTYLEKTYA